jgi:hypothetical protein
MHLTVHDSTEVSHEINEHLNRLFDLIESLKSSAPFDFTDSRGTYSPLQQAAYHLCQCRNLVEQSTNQRRRRNSIR